MEIKTVALDHGKKTDAPMFRVTLNDGSAVDVPVDPQNRHYWEIREWALAQNKAPFKFDFEDLPTGEPEPEQDDQGAEPATVAFAANQTEPANLPDLNLTKEQRKEIAEENKARQG